jgi:hypothetical protein
LEAIQNLLSSLVFLLRAYLLMEMQLVECSRSLAAERIYRAVTGKGKVIKVSLETKFHQARNLRWALRRAVQG